MVHCNNLVRKYGPHTDQFRDRRWLLMSLPSSTKYAVVGAGIHGLSTALHLAQRLKATGKGSGADILIVDKTAIAAGASGIACGVVRNNYYPAGDARADGAFGRRLGERSQKL